LFSNPSFHSSNLIISLDSASPTKKYKKTLTGGKHSSGKESWDPQDQAALHRRAERFKREHQIERQKWVGNDRSSFHHSSANIHQDVFSSTPSSGNWDEPESAIVTSPKSFRNRHSFGTPGHATQDCRNLSGVIQRLPSTHIRGFLVPPCCVRSCLILSQEPDPKKIRPYSVLRETVDQLKNRWKQKENYSWICSQFKSVRQDLTVSPFRPLMGVPDLYCQVQGIKNEFTVNVYEIHARMALEKVCTSLHSRHSRYRYTIQGDMVEYNQCQSMLSSLYDLGLGAKNRDEFAAYRILMFLHGLNRSGGFLGTQVLRWTDCLRSPLDLNLFVGQLTSQQKSNPCVLHALNVQRALSMGNYHLFFSLYNTVPNMGGYIMDHFVERERIRALLVMTKSYVPPNMVFSIEPSFLAHSDTSRYLWFSSSRNSHSRTSQKHLASFLPTIVPSSPTPITPASKKCLIANLPLLLSLR